ncbi:hypothetical protein Tco_0671674 [Tanacetum coccineum]
MKRHIEIVKDDEVAINAIPLATKPPVIVDYKIDKDGRIGYFKLIRADGSSKRYSLMIKMLQDGIRVDALWKGCNRPLSGEHACSFAWNTKDLSKLVKTKSNLIVSNDEGNGNCLVDILNDPNTLVEFKNKQGAKNFVDIQKAKKVDCGKDLANVGIIEVRGVDDTTFMKELSLERRIMEVTYNVKGCTCFDDDLSKKEMMEMEVRQWRAFGVRRFSRYLLEEGTTLHYEG